MNFILTLHIHWNPSTRRLGRRNKSVRKSRGLKFRKLSFDSMLNNTELSHRNKISGVRK